MIQEGFLEEEAAALGLEEEVGFEKGCSDRRNSESKGSEAKNYRGCKAESKQLNLPGVEGMCRGIEGHEGWKGNLRPAQKQAPPECLTFPSLLRSHWAHRTAFLKTATG